MSGRCKACNLKLEESEGKWDYELQRHDELCSKCNKVVQQSQDQIPESEKVPTGDALIDSGALE